VSKETEDQNKEERLKRVADGLVAEIYELPLFDLGSKGDSRLSGILSPVYDDSLVKKYAQLQFFQSAHIYIERYQDTELFQSLISKAFQRIAFTPQGEQIILDIGSGAGNTVFPLLYLCPDAHVIASDLSVDMLAYLKMGLEKLIIDQGMDRSCFLVQLNAEELDFVEESIDMVVGASVLHHMISPEKTLGRCAQILKKGGFAIFFEPFEEGNIIIRAAYHAILNDSRQTALSEKTTDFLETMMRDYDVRMVRDKSASRFSGLNDKWLFNKKYFSVLAEEYGYSDCISFPLRPTEQQFLNHTLTTLRLFGGMERDDLPDWAWEIIQQFDQCFSEQAKEELLIEGCIILKK
jgi:ubiquinone/menaquinone biosynthesis C-methylase UbiE